MSTAEIGMVAEETLATQKTELQNTDSTRRQTLYGNAWHAQAQDMEMRLGKQGNKINGTRHEHTHTHTPPHTQHPHTHT